MHHYDGLTGSEAGSEGSSHSPPLGDDPTVVHTGLAGEHPAPAADTSPFGGHEAIPGFGAATAPHIGQLPGGIPDPALAAGLHNVTAAVTNVTIDRPVFISDHTAGDHAQTEQPVHPDKHSPHGDSLLSHAASEWLGPAAVTPVAAAAGHMLMKWAGKRRLSAGNVDDLAQRLREGDRVMAIVEADELVGHGRSGGRLGETGRIPGQGVEVPVEVLSVNRSAASGATVLVNDDGGPVGKLTVPIEVFDAAWQLADRLAYTLRQEGGRTSARPAGV